MQNGTPSPTPSPSPRVVSCESPGELRSVAVLLAPVMTGEEVDWLVTTGEGLSVGFPVLDGALVDCTEDVVGVGELWPKSI